MPKTIFDDLFLDEEEQREFDLKQLANKFILSREDLLRILRCDFLTSFESAQRIWDSYLNYLRSGD